MNKVKMGMRGLNSDQKVAKAAVLQKGLLAHFAFSASSKLITELEQARQSLEKAQDIAAYGDKRAIGARNLCEKNLDKIIREAAIYVDLNSKGNEELIKDVGFEVRRRNNQPAVLTRPEGLKAKHEDEKGALALSWKPVANSRNYRVQVRKKDKKNWKSACFTTKCKCILDGLMPGTEYEINVMAMGSRGMSPSSKIEEFMAT
jgi:hypothetical protein